MPCGYYEGGEFFILHFKIGLKQVGGIVIKELIFKDEIFQNEKDTVRIYEGLYDDEPCYCLKHNKTGAMMIFDFEKKLAEEIIKKSKRTQGIAVDRKKNGFVFKIHAGEHEHSISLRLYLYAKYNELPLRSVSKTRIALYDDSVKADGIYDFRKKNLYEMGHHDDRISILERPDHPEERYLCLTIGERVEVFDYSTELYDLLTSKMIGLGYNKSSKREYAVVHFDQSREGYSIYNLSKLILLFYRFYRRYQRMVGALQRFINAVPDISEEFGYDCGHVNAVTWNGCSSNIMPMSSETNNRMRNYIIDFVGRYRANAIVLPQAEDVILIELFNAGRPCYFQCNTPEDYCDLQKQLLGKTTVMQKTSIVVVGDKLLNIDTPKEARDKQGRKSVKGFEEEQLWEYCDMRDRLQKLYETEPERFFIWQRWNGKGISIEQAAVIAAFLSSV